MMAAELEHSPQVGDIISLNVQETVSADFLGVLDLRLIERLRLLPERRSVWKTECQGVAILLKLYVPHPKQERDIGREWHHSVELQEAGLEIPPPLFIARGDGELRAVGFHFIEGGATIDSLLETEDRGLPQQILTQLVALHRRQHEAGWFQRDDHLGNYLWSQGKLWMLDAGSFEFSSSPLPERERLANMALLAANIPLPLKFKFNQAMSSVYGRALVGFDSAAKAAIHTRIRNYYKKTRRACTEFEHVKSGRKSWLACRDINEELKLKLLSDPDQFFDGESLVKNGNTCTVVEVSEAGRSYILKRYNQKSLMYRLTHCFMTPRALLSWSNGHVLRLFGVSTPRPVACLLLRAGQLVQRGYLLMEKVDATRLSDVDSSRMSNSSLEIPVQFAEVWRHLDALDATHGDMKASNFMVDAEGGVSLIDLDSLEFHRTDYGKRSSQTKDMTRFMRNWEMSPKVKSAFKQAVDR